MHEIKEVKRPLHIKLGAGAEEVRSSSWNPVMQCLPFYNPVSSIIALISPKYLLCSSLGTTFTLVRIHFKEYGWAPI